jgi:putative PEP-CTERM system TPR-repeat lipoprotein
VLSQALKLQPANVEALVTLARVESAAGNLDAARDAAQRAVAADSANLQARLVLAEIATSSGDVSAAITQLEEARSRNTEAVEPRLALARAYLQQRKTREADTVIGEVERMARDKPVLAGALGQLYTEAGRFEAALEWFRTAAIQNPGNPRYLLDVARTQLAMSNNAGARETLEKLVLAHPQFIPAAAQLVLLDLREQRREAALDRLAKLSAAHPDEASVALLEGDVALASGSYAAAASTFDRAFQLSPSGAAAIRMYRARQLGKLPDAAAPLTAWLKRRPDDIATRLVLAEEYVRTGQSERAIEHYQIAAGGPSPNAMALNNLAWLYQSKGDNRAEATALRAYKAAPQSAAIADTYGWILVENGRPVEGLPILRQASESAGQPQIRYHYAAALAKVGRSDAARKELDEIVRSAGTHPAAAQARQLLGELGGAGTASSPPAEGSGQ